MGICPMLHVGTAKCPSEVLNRFVFFSTRAQTGSKKHLGRLWLYTINRAPWIINPWHFHKSLGWNNIVFPNCTHLFETVPALIFPTGSPVPTHCILYLPTSALN